MPVLYVTDGDAFFSLAAEIARYRGYAGLSQLVVVGIGYGLSFTEFAQKRTSDLTPPQGSDQLEAIAPLTNLIGNESGGADAFLSILIENVGPELARRCPETANGQQILFGHSLGGLFAMNALLSRPDAFDVYLASSPAIWWDNFAITNRLHAFTDALGRLAKQPRVLISVGSKEQDSPTEAIGGLSLADAQTMVARSRMVDAAREFADELSCVGLKEARYIEFQGEDHGSVVPAALSRGVCFALGHK
jgi:predicted alpha/beta superfamily hydrolase